MANNNYSGFQNTRSSPRLTISDQIDLLYFENNDLKSYINQMKLEKDELIKNYEEKLCYLEYNQNTVSEKFSNDITSYETHINELTNEVRKLKNVSTEQLSENRALKEDYKKLEERYRVANEYINVLPTPQESDRLNKNLNRLKAETDRYKIKYHEAESSIKRLESELADKTVELANLCDQEVVMKSQMDLLSEKLSRVKCSSVIKEESVCDWTFSSDLFGDMRMTIQRYKEELGNYKQLLEAERIKYNNTVSSNQKKIDELQMELDCEVDTINTLRKEIDNKQSTIVELERRLKIVINEKQDIFGNMMDLKNEIERIDVFSNDTIQTLFKKLINEIKICVKETEIISNCLYRLFNKEDLDISVLINCSEFDNLSIDDVDQPLGSHNLNIQLESLKQTRLRILELKNALLQYCTNNMAADVKFCLTQ